MKKNLKAALYNPYLDVLGGGEKHILSIMQALEKFDYQISIFWDKDLTQQFEKRLGIKFNTKVSFLPNMFGKKTGLLDKALILKSFDLFFYVTDGSYFISPARKNFIFAMVPDQKLYQMNLSNRLKTLNYQFISNSHYTQKLLTNWGIKSRVIYPYIDDQIVNSDTNQPKEKIILSIGRFFGHLHSKKQDIMINSFKKLRQKYPLFKEFKLILAGGLKEEDKPYYKALEKLIGQDQSMLLLPNINTEQLVELYKKTRFFWHFAGYGVDESRFPDRVEHLGLTPLEAMATGCLTFCYKAGGPEEIIKDGSNGFLFHTEEELFEKMIKIADDDKKQELIKYDAKKFVLDNFSRPVFLNRVKKNII